MTARKEERKEWRWLRVYTRSLDAFVDARALRFTFAFRDSPECTYIMSLDECARWHAGRHDLRDPTAARCRNAAFSAVISSAGIHSLRQGGALYIRKEASVICVRLCLRACPFPSPLSLFLNYFFPLRSPSPMRASRGSSSVLDVCSTAFTFDAFRCGNTVTQRGRSRVCERSAGKRRSRRRRDLPRGRRVSAGFEAAV